jgi:serine/threonine protein kinase
MTGKIAPRNWKIFLSDATLHLVKKPSYRSELRNLRRCKGSLYVVQLFEKTHTGDLVFEKFPSDLFTFSLRSPRMTTATVKQFMLHLIDAVADIHSRSTIRCVYCYWTASHLSLEG